MKAYVLRFERTGEPKIDVQRGAESLDEARTLAEWWHHERFKLSDATPATGSTTYNWRGAVCFVDCVPAEESVSCRRRYDDEYKTLTVPRWN